MSARTPAVKAAAGADATVLDRAVEVFVHGFAFTRSFTHPYVPQRLGPVWVVRDAPRKNAADYRREEYIARGVGAAEVDHIARGHTRGRFVVCAVRAPHEPDAPLRAAWKALGYRLQVTEPVMAHPLRRVPRLPEPLPVRRVLSQDLADRLAKAARSRQVLPEHLAPDAPLRQYAALDGERPVGRVRSIVVGDATWVSNMYVEPEYRRRGVGRSMLARMLRDDRAHGSTLSVLTASHTGALLYPRVGYELIGELLMFMPTKR
jgi:GNAT superfamily N-acetyltransferase